MLYKHKEKYLAEERLNSAIERQRLGHWQRLSWTKQQQNWGQSTSTGRQLGQWQRLSQRWTAPPEPSERRSEGGSRQGGHATESAGQIWRQSHIGKRGI